MTGNGEAASTAQLTETAASVTAPSKDVTGRPKLLLVDDDRIVLRLLRAIFGASYELFEATDGEEALRLAAQERPAAVLLDVNLPWLDGFGVCRRIKANPETRNAKVVLITARTDAASEHIGRAAGADGYFVKPYGPIELLEGVEALLALPSPRM